MNQQRFLITLYLLRNGEDWSWDITDDSSRTVNLRKGISPADLYKKILENLKDEHLIDYVYVQNIGLDITKSIFPSKIVDRLKRAANIKGSIIHFRVPSEWANIPFELCYLPNLGFLGHLFCIGTSIIGKSHRKNIFTPPRDKILIITDSTEKAREEAEELKEKARENNWDVHVLLQGTPSKILSEMDRVKIVHYAGDAPDKGNGWQLGSGQVFNIDDLQTLRGKHHVPEIIFSNSCHSGSYSNDYISPGITGTFINEGVSQVIGTVCKVNNNEAKEFSLLFYKGLFRGQSPAESLLAAKRESMASNKDSVTSLFYRLFGDPRYNLSSGGFMRKVLGTIRRLGTLHKFKILYGVISFLMVCLLIWSIIEIRGRFCITLGFTDYRSQPDIKKLERYLTDKICKPAEEKLPFPQCIFYSFKAKVIPGNYTLIFSVLKEKEIDIAFVSPFCYLYVKYLDPNKLEGLEPIGVKVDENSETYRSGFLVRKDSGIHSSDDINENTVNKFIHGDLLSTSTYVIPRIFLWERGLTEIESDSEPDRWEMIKKIKNSKADQKFIGALSNEDWGDRTESTSNDSLRFIPIDNIPIPYDAVFRNQESRFYKKEWVMILKALSDCIKKIPDSWEEHYRDFTDYVASPIITGRPTDENQKKECGRNKCYIVFLPGKKRDLYHFKNAMSNTKSIMIDIYRFEGVRGPQYELEKIKVGSGRLKKMNSSGDANKVLLLEPNIDPGIDNILGMHILFETH